MKIINFRIFLDELLLINKYNGYVEIKNVEMIIYDGASKDRLIDNKNR